MKRFSLHCVLSFLFFAITLRANPIPEPRAVISEFMFDASGHWMLEVGFLSHMSYRASDFDSILVSSKTGISRIRLEGLPDGTSLFVVTSDSLLSPLAIDPQGDCVVLYSFITIFPPSMSLRDSLVFGTLPGSMFDAIQPGFSVTRLPDLPQLVKDRTPTIGAPNDTAGTLGTLRGRIFDSQNREVHHGDFRLDNAIMFHSDGSFTTRIFSRWETFIAITEVLGPTTSGGIYVDPFSLRMEPDSTVDQDIHLHVEYPDGIKEKTDPDAKSPSLIAYPNPFNATTNFSVVIPQTMPFRAASIEIYNAIGQRIKNITVGRNTTVRWDGTNSRGEIQSTGIYYYRLALDNRTVKEGSVILLK